MSNPTTTRKRGRPPKYTSTEERETAKIERQQKRRDAVRATERNTQLNSVHSTGALSITLPGPSHPLIVRTEEPSLTIEALLPPLSPGLAPQEHDDDDDLIDNASPPPDYPGDMSPPPETLILPTPPTRSEQPQDYIEIRTPSPTISGPAEDICTLARVLADQLYQHHGCCHQCHEQQHTAHQEAHPVHTPLADYLEQINPDGDFPDVLSSPTIATHGSNLAEQVTPVRKQQVYCGVDPQQPDALPTHLCIAADHRPGLVPEVTLDVDSVGGLVKSLAVAQQGIRWYPTQMPVSDLQSGLHLNPILVQYLDSNGRVHRVHRPLHQVPHYTFGRLIGFEDISMYLLFPRLYRENQQSSRLLDQHFQQWMDDILLPIIHRCYSGDLVQHYPSSFDHSRRNATARGVEMRSQRVDPVAREQHLFYFLPPEALATIWEQILAAIQRPSYHHFQDLQILIEGKNLKTLTKASTLLDLIEGFQGHWQRAINESYLSDLFFYDLGKETCLPATVDRPESHPHTLLWRRCCLDAYSQWIHRQQPSDAPRAHEQFYPMSLLQDTGSMTLETRRSSPQRQSGLFYSQFYASIKEIFTAGNTYPFTNSGMETLALDPKLRKTWQTVGGGLSHNPIALNRAYLATKQRCYAALQGSQQKVFGLREEHRVSHTLFNQIMQEFQDRGQFTIPFPRTLDTVEHFYALPTVTLLQWFQWNINKFCVGFEMVYSLNDRHFVTWEHTRMMLMFLRCLPFSYSGGLLERVSGCWRDVWFRPDPTQLDGLRRCEGLGFQQNMEQSGYGWFLNKINWEMMVFRQPAAPYMQFNNPSLQAAYHARYSQVRDVRVDFICISQIHQWMIEFSGIHTCQEYLQKYLRQLCLRAFRKDVFAQIQPLIKKESIPAALAGDIPLCWPSLEEALLPQHCPPYVAAGNRMAVKHINVLFTWLWEWRDGRFQRKGWENKPYRLLYQKSIEIITLIQGKDAARQWKQGLKTSFIQSHWMLPYPQNNCFMRKSKEGGIMWWSSVHQGLDQYYHELNCALTPFPTSYIKHHPTKDWGPSRPCLSHLDYTIQPEQRLLRLPNEELVQHLHDLQRQWNVRSLQPRPSVYQPSHVVFEVDQQIQDPFNSITGPVESWSMNACTRKLRPVLYKYELLQHQRQCFQRQRRPATQPDYYSDTEPEALAEDHEQTSDEEGIEPQKTSLQEHIQRIEKRMFQIISEDRKGWMGPTMHNHVIKDLAPKLRRLPYHTFSLLQLLDPPVDPDYRAPPPPRGVTFPPLGYAQPLWHNRRLV